MVAGVERYFQIARCFRDEDLRSDRQPEFTQLDLEMSFVEAEDIRSLMETMFVELTAQVSNKPIQQQPFPIITYADALELYGVDRPDLRFGQTLFNVSNLLADSGFGVFSKAIAGGGQVKGVVYPGGANMTRREIDEMTDFVKKYGAKGLAWIGVTGEADGIVESSGAQAGDLILLVADKPDVVAQSLSNLRLEIGQRADLIDKNKLAYCWVVDFPLLEYNEDHSRWQAVHHPFTSARPEDWDKLESDPGNVLARAYDIVLNGWEVGGGSIRIHDTEQQQSLFAAIGLSSEEVEEQFGHLLDAFQYGAPPHGGIALGIDRLVAILAETGSIRDVIAFPKTATGTDLMVDSPSPISEEQMTELHVALRQSKKKTK